MWLFLDRAMAHGDFLKRLPNLAHSTECISLSSGPTAWEVMDILAMRYLSEISQGQNLVITSE